MNTIQDVKTYKDFLDFTRGDVILCNRIAQDVDYLDLENGDEYEREYDNEAGTYSDIYQYYIISNDMAEFIKQFTNEILYYHHKYDIYVWGITHYGTSWDSVNIELKNIS